MLVFPAPKANPCHCPPNAVSTELGAHSGVVLSMNITWPAVVTHIMLNSPAPVPNGTPPNPELLPRVLDTVVRSIT